AEPSDPILPEQLRFDEMSRASANPEEPERPPLRAPWGRNAGTAEEAAAQAQAAGAQGRDESGDDARAERRRPAWLTQPPLPSDDRSRLPQPRPPAPEPPPRPAPAATPGSAGATRAGGATTAPGAPRVEPPPARPPASGPAANERARSEAEPRPGPVAAPVGTDAATRPAAPAVLAAESGANGAAPAAASPGLAPLALSLAHELRNRLVAIRTFAALLPERAEDRGFRDEFSQVVGADVRRMERALERLASFAALPGPAAREPVDVAALLDEELEALRGEIESRRLLVLKELDRGQPAVLADRAALAFAFEALLFRAFEWMPDRGDLYLASKAVAASRDAGPSVRVVLRFHRPGERRGAAGASAPRDRELALELVLAELALRPHGGRLRVDATDAEEMMIVVDLPGA
ncbi:MAG TPA: hypothetical protein VHQ66_02310, partial [Myxococcota bacterium]|nr:hypothetical protein [Myxococcota bacterium]